jgi:deferrochelatase/peroxidase EfeB
MVDPGSWRLDPSLAAQAQGLIVSPFAHLPEAVVLLLDATGAPGSGWLRDLLQGPGGLAITPATGKALDSDGAVVGCAALAFTATGLQVLGLSQAVLESFAEPFVEGMHEPHRRRRLGDFALEPAGRVRRPLWGGNMPLLPGTAPDVDAVVCDKTVHAAVLLYHETAEQLAAMAAPVRARLASSGVCVVHELALSLRFDGNDPPIAREHFGFADGISQPVPAGPGIVTSDGSPYPPHPVHRVFPGDLLIGLLDSYGESAPGAVVPNGVPGTSALDVSPEDKSQRCLGRLGSYLVMRELSQDVAAFEASMESAAQSLGKDKDWVAERVVGRTRDGVILAPDPPAPDDDGPGNDFLYFDTDVDGRFCPYGSHIRRANPRDGLAPTAGDKQTMLRAANNHRILRRGRKYAAYPVPDAADLPGLLFMCLNTDIRRQFEFVQQTWMLNPSFAALVDEQDPLLGPQGSFTIPADPLRLRPTIDTFVRFIGGEYFFLPSLPALTYFMSLPSGGRAP